MAGKEKLSDDEKLRMPTLNDAVAQMTNRELMADARRLLSGNWGMAILGYLLYGLLLVSFSIFVLSAWWFLLVSGSEPGSPTEYGAVAVQVFAQWAELLFSGPILVGFCGFFLGISQLGEARLELLFAGFRRFWTSLATYVLYGILVFLWSLLLIIPGIIAAFRYAMVWYVVADDEDASFLEAFRRSKRMMKGKKWRFFCLHWRFFGWALLCTILPIGWLWLVPYMQTTFAKFYEDVKIDG